MGGIQGFIPEDSVNREVLLRGEVGLLGQLEEHFGRDSSGVGAHDVLLTLLFTPLVVPTLRPINPHFMGGLHLLQVLSVPNVRFPWVRQKESVMGITGGVLLRLEQTIEIPKGTFYKVVGWHFLKAHFK